MLTRLHDGIARNWLIGDVKMAPIPSNPHKRTDRVGSRFHTASNVSQAEPPYVSEKEGTKWLSSGIPFEEKSPLRERLLVLLWFISFPFVAALCFGAIWMLGLASNDMTDWGTAGAFTVIASLGLIGYIIAGRKLYLI